MKTPRFEFARDPDAPRSARLIAHRGVPALHPENCAASFVTARDFGAPMVEFDVRATRDGFLVVLHDRTPARLTGSRSPAVATDARTLLAETYLDAPDQTLLLLDEALALLVSRTSVDIEIKPDPEVDDDTYARLVLDALVRAGSPQDVIVTSERVEILAAVRAIAPRLATGVVFRSLDTRDPVRVARGADASVLVASRRRVDASFVAAARAAGLAVWAYTIDAASDASRLLDLGCEALFVDDWPGLARALDGDRTDARAAAQDEPRFLVVDAGSTATKAALVSPRQGVLARASAPTPVTREGTRVEHDADAQVRVARALIEKLARRHPERPLAVAVTSQRSTGLWLDRGTPATPAVSWRDTRGEAVVASLEARRAELEQEAGLPLAPAWTALLGRALLGDAPPPAGYVLAPLGAFLAQQLARGPLVCDPTLANRTFLLEARRARWSPLLLRAFGYDETMLPALRPTVDARDAVVWPAGGSAPLAVLAGDQPCAYIGAAGPTERRLVLNVGTAGFAMRVSEKPLALPEGGRRGPLWTSSRRTDPWLFLEELPVLAPDRDDLAATSDDAARAVARAVAFGDPAPASFAERLGDAISRMRRPDDQSVLLAGGVIASPQFVALVGERSPLPLIPLTEGETTIVGAARLAAAACRVPWAFSPKPFLGGRSRAT